MTVSTSTNSVVYRGNGAATQFAAPFKVLDEDHLVVRRRVFATGVYEHTYVGTDYSYVGIGASSGTLTLAGAALDDDYELVIERIVPYTQDLDIVNSGGFYPDTVEEQLDLMTMATQQLVDLAGRGMVVPLGEDGLELTKASDRAGKFSGFDAAGQFAALSGTGSDSALRTDLAASGGGALVGRTGGGTVQSFITGLALISSGLAGSIASGNLIVGSPGAGASLTPGALAGDHDGDANTGFGIDVFENATTAYASTAFGYGALANVTTGHSNSAFGYQTGISLTTGIGNVLIGVDAAYLSTTISTSVVVGRHCMNGANYAGTTTVVIGHQCAQLLTVGSDIIAIGSNTMFASPGTGSIGAVCIGGNVALKSSVSNSILIGLDVLQSSSGANPRSASECAVTGYRAVFGVQTIASLCAYGALAGFQADGDTTAITSGAWFGHSANYLNAGNQCTVIGPFAGRRSTKQTIANLTLVGYRVGDETGADWTPVANDIAIGNGQVLSSLMLWGNTGTNVCNLRGNKLTFVGLPTYADNAAAVTGALPVGCEYKTVTGERRVVV